MKKWVKLYTEIIDDPKIARLTWAERGIWSALLALAGKIEARDPDGSESGLLGTTTEVIWYLRADAEQITAALAVFEQEDMAFREGDYWYLTHWTNRQARTPSERPEAIKRRQNVYQERRKTNAATTPTPDLATDAPNALVTPPNAEITPLDKIRLDKIRVEESAAVTQAPKPVPNFNLPHDDPLPRPIRILNDVLRFQPARDSEPWKLVVKSIPDNEGALARWREAVTAWYNNGLGTRNVAGMVDWYKSGKRSSQINTARAEPTKEELKQKEAAKHAEDLRIWKLQHPEEAKNEAVHK